MRSRTADVLVEGFRSGMIGRLGLGYAHENHFWQALCHFLDLLDAAGLGARQRGLRTVELRDRVAAALAGGNLADGASRLDPAGIPWSPVHDITGTAAGPHFWDRGLFATLLG